MRRPARGLKFWQTAGALVAIGALSFVAYVPHFRTVSERGTSAQFSAGRAGLLVRQGSSTTTQLANVPPPIPGLECVAGRNGGATDDGVVSDSIKLGATVVDSGIGAAFLSDVRYGMEAVVNTINASGGVCGRRLDLVLKDDGWDAQRGAQFLRSLVEDDHIFALAVVPSSEGLRAASAYLEQKGIPVVGTDGMLIGQYTAPNIWPVAASTITAMHVMVKNAFDHGARHFAMVYDSNFRFGIEGAYAFNAAVKRVTGHDVPGYSDPLQSPRCSQRFCGIEAGQPSYQSETEIVQSSCGSDAPCDYVAYLMEPETAQTWMRGGGMQAGFNGSTPVSVEGPQPLFNRSFAINCAQQCNGMSVWTGFTPPVEPFASDPNVSGYVNALRQTNSSADPANSFVEGGFVGMRLLVDALQKTGPDLTRVRLQATLDSEKLDLGLSKPLSFAPGQHFANQCMRAFSIQSKPSFAGWRQETDWVCDPWAGLDIPSE
ncbi:MAG: ABC transporter substrate-binding protein [Actinomycetota bacterium]